MTQETRTGEDLVSALMDGQLRGEEFAGTVERLGHDEEARLTWHAYHLVGDVLRSGESIVGASEADFLRRLKVRLEQAAPLPAPAGAVNSQAHGPVADRAANDGAGRWKLLAGLASLGVFVALGWQLAGGLTEPHDAQQVMLRDPQLDALLAAHRQAGGAPALQMSAGFLRNATFEGTSR